ncbi:MAG: transposase [Planctomycetota bacterium]
MCTHKRTCLFGRIVNTATEFSPWGHIVQEEWLRSFKVRREIMPDAYVIMPNHLHAIVWIVDGDNDTGVPNAGATGRSPLPRQPIPPHQRPRGPACRSLGAFMAGFKSAATTRVNTLRNTPGQTFWQRNYHEHIVRNDTELNAIRRYIAANPGAWDRDRENPHGCPAAEVRPAWEFETIPAD